MKQRKNPQNKSKFSAKAFISDFFILLAYALRVKFQSTIYLISILHYSNTLKPISQKAHHICLIKTIQLISL